ncbi:aspartate-semialdehyde dehydrogenase [Prochlorococcus sp. MIT 0801]|uniref:aspartate-semialdehyde dehydrogenase n=1 Tax=Prochlorococcus sp. MIT 0801 TaxID=1501269 RepID=UPI0004F5AF0C|nr:aspartate-semialdehyde dehydrogenase [Prochlorococcus sp. MIT 0801]AIQ98300.1 Aspartate-semialdehyde dehydrogenase [Prochlorococcus sp. MIT 0801]
MKPQFLLPNRPLTVAILGSSGAVGKELLALLEERSFPIKKLILLASHRSAGDIQSFCGTELKVEETTKDSFENVDLILASAGSSISLKWKDIIQSSGALMIDNSSAFRMNENVPLIVPEVNPSDAIKHKGIISNPNCTTILLALVLSPLTRHIPIKRIVVSTYQSASGAGAMAMEELEKLSQEVLDGITPKSKVLPYSLAFNLFLHNSPLQSNNYCEEEMKMVNETRKILGDPDLSLTATCVRVPVFRAHSESVNIEFTKPFPVKEAYEILEAAPGVEILEDLENNRFPMPQDVTGRDPISVGRIRQDISNPNALELWLCGDQIRKGAALNAVQIAELLLPKNHE